MFSQQDDFTDTETDDTYQFLAPINDPSSEGQRIFVEEILDIAGYVPEKIETYQSLPNFARIYRVRLDSVNAGLVFIRWNAAKKENYIANNLIQPEWYYNLNTAREIMRSQTNQVSLTIDDVALQASDQKRITPQMLSQFRKKADGVNDLRSFINRPKRTKESKKKRQIKKKLKRN